jgi:hypothetical protein
VRRAAPAQPSEPSKQPRPAPCPRTCQDPCRSPFRALAASACVRVRASVFGVRACAPYRWGLAVTAGVGRLGQLLLGRQSVVAATPQPLCVAVGACASDSAHCASIGGTLPMGMPAGYFGVLGVSPSGPLQHANAAPAHDDTRRWAWQASVEETLIEPRVRACTHARPPLYRMVLAHTFSILAHAHAHDLRTRHTRTHADRQTLVPA